MPNSNIFSCSNALYPKWNTLPYYNEVALPIGVDVLAGSWPLYFFYRNSVGEFFSLKSRYINFNLKKPNTINYDDELSQVIQVQNNLNNHENSKEIEMAKFWGTGVPVNQWLPIALKLIAAYSVTPPMSSRILSCLNCVINDAFVLTWHYKYLYNCPRPCQLDHNLKTILDTPRFPSYPSGHSVVSGACSVLLSYYFPKESDKLNKLAQDASISRLYGGIHFNSDLDEGLKLGRMIGNIAIDHIKDDYDKKRNSVDHIYTNYANAPIMPPYYTSEF